VPKGSGLGCSGILAAGLVKGLRVFAGLETNDPELLVRAYCCERFYGRSGYQDIIGGSWGGVKLIQADGATGLFSPRIERLELPPERLAELRENVLVFYTGKPHLDRQYLLTIPAKYFTRAGDYMYAYENGKQLTRAMAEALSHGDWERLGRLIHEYWDDREYFEEGVTPEYAQRLRRDLAEWCFGTALCGSGHGGYMMAVLRSGARDRVLEYLAARQITQEQVLGFAVSPEGSVVEECK
jgi:galactokinase/mevalonate kinase-like predicted kinase